MKWTVRLLKKALYIITPILVASILMTVSYLKQTSEVISKSQNEAIWFVLQLTKEYSEFIYQLQSYQLGTSDYNDMLIQYEILWSRFNTIVNNSLVEHLDQFEGSITEISHHFTNIKAMEDQLLELPITKNEALLLSLVKDDYDDLQIYLNHKFRLSSSDLGEKIQAVSTLEMIFRYLLISTLLTSMIIAYLLLRESRYHHRLAMYDSLTGIRNRLWLNKKLEKLAKNNQAFNFYLIDLDGFKIINDTQGHHAGDMFLRSVASRLKQLEHPHCFCARMGGDEFAVIELFQQNISGAEPSQLPDQLVSLLNSATMIAGKSLTISASIGISQFPTSAKNIPEVLKQADFAMYEVKQQGKNRAAYFKPCPVATIKNNPLSNVS
jgi:diguanylate cyclase (GGDEF)-like protein